MRSISLRAQVFIIVSVLALGVLSATVFIANAVEGARESIIRLNRDRLSSLTGDLSRRYGSVISFVAPEQFADTSLSQRLELTTVLTGITGEELLKAPNAEAGFFHSLWNREVGFAALHAPSSTPYARLLGALTQSTIDQRQEQWGHHQSENANYLIVTKPVFARNHLVGVAWAFDDLDDELADVLVRDGTPLLQILVVLGIFLASMFVISLRRGVADMQSRLDRLKSDLSFRLPVSRSELGRIASSVNELADTIQKEQREKTELQKAIQQKEKLASLGQLIAGVAHEIRTPLAAMKTRIQLWQRAARGTRARSPRTDITKESMTMVVRELDRMENIVRKLLYFSKERTPKFRDGDLHAVIDSALDVVRHNLRKKRIAIKRFFTTGSPMVPMDENEIREVILNLLANAMEAMPEGGSISITTDRTGERMTVTVEDSGEGIPPAVAAKIFDPFFTTKESGTGLGLSIAYEIIHAHQGTLEYVKTNGGGARFILSLPTMRKLSTSTEQP
jgi:signal transduction histidine kinase